MPKPSVLPLHMFGMPNMKTKKLARTIKPQWTSGPSERYWGIPSSPIVGKNIRFPYVSWLSVQTLCFTVANVSARLQWKLNIGTCYKTQTKIAASKQYWGILSSPIVEKNMWLPYVNWQSAQRGRRKEREERKESSDKKSKNPNLKGGEKRVPRCIGTRV